MVAGLRPVLLICAIFAGSIGHCAESIELVLDQSNAMWRPLPDGTPRIAATRSALGACLASPALADLEIELGLSTVGGRSDISTSAGCEDVGQILPVEGIDLATWSDALGELDPRGGRPLVRGIEEAAHRLASVDGDRKIVVITAGGDQCFGDLRGAWDRISARHPSIELRVIGIDLDQEIAGSMSAWAPTRNASDAATMVGFLRWAMLPPGAGATRPELLDLDITHGGQALQGASISLDGPGADEDVRSPIDQGRAQFRVPPGRYAAVISGDGLETIELGNIVHRGDGRAIGLSLSTSPDVTLAFDRERPLAGGEMWVQFWGAPPGDNWLVLAVAGSPLAEFLARSPASGPTGELALTVPETPTRLELRFTTDIGDGVLQLLGRTAFESDRRRISLQAPERAEIRTPITLEWSGVSLGGDHLRIEGERPDGVETALCIPAGDRGGATVTSPPVPGEYVVRFLTRRGSTVARSSIEVFEILATLDAPGEASPDAEIEVSWIGPNAEQDFVSIAFVDDGPGEYRSFSPTSTGNPLRLTTPKLPGGYELRYVRASDGEVLAREPLEVIAVEITLEVPRVIELGTLIQVSWSGTSGPGDFITVAREGSDLAQKLDSTYVSLGSPVSLAAPFKPGRYVVRYISGENRQLVAEAPIEVR